MLSTYDLLNPQVCNRCLDIDYKLSQYLLFSDIGSKIKCFHTTMGKIHVMGLPMKVSGNSQRPPG